MAGNIVANDLSSSTGGIPSLGGSNVENRMCSAWVNFDGSGTVSIRDGYNVSSITDNGTGNYTVNFSTVMSSADYSTQATGGSASTYNPNPGIWTAFLNGTATTSSVRVMFGYGVNNTIYDGDIIQVQVFGN